MPKRLPVAALQFLVLAALNTWICWRLFWVEYTPNFASIEGSFIGLARYLSRHWGNASWWPIWHCGMPYQDTYVPLLHLTTAIVASAGRFSAAHAYHVVTGAAYALGPATLFLMALGLGASRSAAFFAGLIYSLLSPSALLLPEMAKDLGSALAGRRLQVLTVYGEGPHIAAMTLFPLAILALQFALERKTGRYFGLAALAIAIVFLTNVPGTMALALAVFCWICAQPAGSRARAWRIAAGAAALAYAIACAGIPPSSLHIVFGNVGPMHSGFSQSLKAAPYLLPLLFGAVAAAGYLLTRIRLALFARFGLLYFALTAVLVFTARHSEQFELLPQAGRLHLEMEMGACLMLGWAVWMLYRWHYARYAVIFLGITAFAYQAQNYRGRARFDLKRVDPATRSEYTSARWLDANMNGRRVFAAGSTAFWLNAFTDTPQLIGCCEQGEVMTILDGVLYLMKTAETPASTSLSIEWLQALGVHAIVVNGPESTDEYKDFRSPALFEDLLPVLHREHGDTIYAIPQRSASMAHVVRPEVAMRSFLTPDLTRYVAAIEDAARPEALCEWITPASARIRAHLSRGDLISVQSAYFRGWKAEAGGRPAAVSADGIGLILVHPECEGECEVTLRWTGPWDLYPSLLISCAALGVLAWLIWVNRRYGG